MSGLERQFLVIKTPSLWEKGVVKENIQVAGLGISLGRSDTYVFEETFFPGQVQPLALDMDPCGVLYILDQVKKGVSLFDITTGCSRYLPCLELADSLFPGGTGGAGDIDNHSLAVGSLDIYLLEPGAGQSWIRCRARLNGQVRWEKELSEEEFRHTRVATREPGELYVLDTGSCRVYRTGREWRKDGNSEVLALSGAVPGQPGEDKTVYYEDYNYKDIASDGENNFYLLAEHKDEDRAGAIIFKFDPLGGYLLKTAVPFKEGARFFSLAVAGEGAVFLAYSTGDEERNGAGETGGILRLAKSQQYPGQGVYVSPPLDSTIDGCRWHKVVLDVEIPENTQVKLYHFASDQNAPPGDEDFNEATLAVNPRDTLVTEARGRYIFFKIELLSDDMGNACPLVHGLTAYFPHSSYLRYLPEIYQENKDSREFLECFLSLFETFVSRGEEEIRNFTRYLDPTSTPAHFIPWLSSWLGAAQEEHWPLELQRLLLKKAPELYKMRGTRAALSKKIEIYYGSEPVICEQFQFDCIDNPAYKALIEKLYGTDPYSFTVLLPPRWRILAGRPAQAVTASAEEQGAIQRIIDIEKPAHTQGVLHLLQPWFYLDMHTYLGVNTVLSRSEFVLEVSSALGRDTIIAGVEEAGQVGRKSRIGIDLTLT